MTGPASTREHAGSCLLDKNKHQATERKREREGAGDEKWGFHRYHTEAKHKTKGVGNWKFASLPRRWSVEGLAGIILSNFIPCSLLHSLSQEHGGKVYPSRFPQYITHARGSTNRVLEWAPSRNGLLFLPPLPIKCFCFVLFLISYPYNDWTTFSFFLNINAGFFSTWNKFISQEDDYQAEKIIGGCLAFLSVEYSNKKQIYD